MTHDLEYLFKTQIDECTDKLCFMLIEDNLQLIHRHPAAELSGLSLLLDNFQYKGTDGRIPRFVK